MITWTMSSRLHLYAKRIVVRPTYECCIRQNVSGVGNEKIQTLTPTTPACPQAKRRETKNASALSGALHASCRMAFLAANLCNLHAYAVRVAFCIEPSIENERLERHGIRVRLPKILI